MEKQGISQENIERLNDRFEEIQTVKNDGIRTVRLSAMMTDMERMFDMPMINAERISAFNRAYPEVMDLYVKVSQARCF